MRSSTAIAAVAVAGVLGSAVASRAEEIRCTALLSSATLKTATGFAMEPTDPVNRGTGASECAWMARGQGGFKSAMVTLLEPEGIKAGMTPEATLAEIFAMNAQSTEEVSGKKREVLPGIGKQAVLIPNEQQTVVYIETADGFVSFLSTGLSKPQVVAVAKAIAQAKLPPPGAASTAPTEEARVEGAAILVHPVGKLAVDYARLLHTGKSAELVALQSKAARDRRRAMPASEQRESDAYVKKNFPAEAALEAGIRSGGVLLIQGSKATLNVTSSETKKNADGSITASASTTAIPFEREDGVWKIAQ